MGHTSTLEVHVVDVDVHQCPQTAGVNVVYKTTVPSVEQEFSCSTFMEMFPQLGEAKIHEALTKSNNDIELAVAQILSGSPTATNTPQQVYASLDFCNVVERIGI